MNPSAERPRVLLTGAAGDVGTRLRPLLLAAYGALRLSDQREPAVAPAPGETFVRADLADPAQVARIVADIDATAAFFGDRTAPVKDAVQPGRRITTLRHRDLGMSVHTAVISTTLPA